MERTTWVEVSAAGLRANLEAVTRHASASVCAVVKANAYGHGLAGAARILADAGAAMLGVTRVEEARALREAGVRAPVLIMMPVPDAAEAAALDCHITVGSAEQVAAVPQGARAHLKVDVGMGRLGVGVEEAAEAARSLAARGALEAVWSHLPDAAGPSGRAHLERFRTLVTALRHSGLGFRAHIANSAAVSVLPDAGFDMVRVGTLLYGQDPAGARAPFPLTSTFDWRARIVAVRDLQPGATVGYGSEWRAKEQTRVATIPVGYADGFTVEPVARTPSPAQAARTAARLAARALGRDARAVLFGDRRAPVLGRVGMQAITVSLAGLPDVAEGSVATIPARRLMVGQHIERVYT